jgi:hypothetical protein
MIHPNLKESDCPNVRKTPLWHTTSTKQMLDFNKKRQTSKKKKGLEKKKSCPCRSIGI